MQNPYFDSNWNDLSEDNISLTNRLKGEIINNPEFYSQLLADLYFKYKHNIFDTPSIIEFKKTMGDIKNFEIKSIKMSMNI